MIQDIDIHRSAKILMDKHGDKAFQEALNRAADLKASGDDEGKRVWLRIADSVAFMQMPSNLVKKAVH